MSKTLFMNTSIHTPTQDVSNTDIAIIGMACRFPGGARNPDEFFEFLLQNGDGIVCVPPDRWSNKAYYDADKEKKNRMYVNRGGFLEKIDQFDPLFFGMSPAEATRVDPQHRWLLELTYEAFENAGLKAKDLRGSDTAVYIGQFMHDYEQIQLDTMAHTLLNSHSATGPSMTLTANRISYVFDLKGPSVTLDTACSSSLVALDLACKAIHAGDSRIAIAGGVNILLRPEITMSICKASMLSPDGRCKSFDASANGYVRSEGAGVVVVKKLSDALLDGDPICAVIKASSVNQDGQTLGITVPNGEAQKTLLLKSLSHAKIRGDEIDYAEAHGTGTAVGDPIEVNALGSVVGPRPEGTQVCVIGSVKSNIGHTEAAAGMAGLIKTVMAMKHGEIPANLHYHKTNPAIDLKALNVQVAAERTPWPFTGKSRKALINSFGFGGTNANVILEESPLARRLIDEKPTQSTSINLLPISAKTEPGLKDQARNYLDFLRRSANQSNVHHSSLHDICFTAGTRREHQKYRLVASGVDQADLEKELESFLKGEASPNLIKGAAASEEPTQICFVFSGMGTQWAGMGRKLYETESVFRAALDRCSEAFRAYTGASLIDALYAETDSSKINRASVAQPAIFSIQIAIADLLKLRGLTPHAVVGHSAGEMAAACVAGALKFEDAVRVVYHRSRLQQTTEGLGKMLAVGLTEIAVQPYLASCDEVSIAAINSEDAITLSGNETQLKVIAAKLEAAGIFARFLKVDVPYHSPVMDRLRAPLIEALDGLQTQTPHTPLYSTVSGQLTRPGDWTANYWAENVRAAVFFKKAIDEIARTGIHSFLEIAPHTALATSVEKNLADAKISGLVVPTLKRAQDDALMFANALASLHVAGWPLDWSKLCPAGSRHVTLPNYAWQHASYWCEADEVRKARIENVRSGSGALDTKHPLLGSRLNSMTPLWQQSLDLQEQTYLVDHQVEGEPVYPAAAYIETALAIAQREFGRDQVALEDIEFKRALFLDREKPTLIESNFNPDTHAVTISAIEAQTGAWSVYSHATLAKLQRPAPSMPLSLNELRVTYTSKLDKAAFYERCTKLGLSYQKDFQPVVSAQHGIKDVLVDLALPDSLLESHADYAIHPVILDGSFQSVFACVSRGYLPVKIASLHYFKKPSARAHAVVTLTRHTDTDVRGDVTLFEDDGTISVEISGIELKSTKTQKNAEKTGQLLYAFNWEQLPEPVSAPTQVDVTGSWILFASRQGLGPKIAAQLKSRGQSVIFVEPGEGTRSAFNDGWSIRGRSPEDLTDLFKRVPSDCRGLIYLWGSEQDSCQSLTADNVFENCRVTTVVPMHLVQALEQITWAKSLQLFFVTRGAQQVLPTDAAPEPTQGALWGFGRVYAAESSTHRLSLVDLPAIVDDDLLNRFTQEILDRDFEPELSLRANARFVNRLKALTETQLPHYLDEPSLDSARRPIRIARKFRSNETEKLIPRLFNLPQLAERDVELRVSCASLRLQDLDAILGPGRLSNSADASSYPRGYACIGHVTALGREVRHLTIGDRIIAFCHQGLASMAQADAQLAVKMPEPLPCRLAISLAASFLPVFYALLHVAQLKEGEDVLIHEAGDTWGLAAVQLALLKGARVHASARTSESRAQLAGLGNVSIYDSTTDAFFSEIAKATNGAGIDVALNALDDRWVGKTLDLLKPFGRFIELGRKRMPRNPAHLDRLFSKNISYNSFDLSQLVVEKAALCRSMLAEIVQLHTEKKIEPVSTFAVPMTEAKRALDHLRGKSALETVCIEFPTTDILAAPSIDRAIVKANATYLITGGLGGLGLEVLKWLADGGARSIVLLGRSAPNQNATEAIEAVRARGVEVQVMSADITATADVARILDAIAGKLPPLAGIFHAAGVLDDGIIARQTADRFKRVLAPKILGAWNLHALTLHLPLDFFVCFSSIASVIGWAGQSNYAAANAFMDTLAHHRRALGKAGLSINWGPWAGSGMAAKLDAREQKRMNDVGMTPLSAEAGLKAMAQLLAFHVPQAGVFEVDWSRFFKLEPNPSLKLVLQHLHTSSAKTGSVNFTEQFNAAAPEHRPEMLSACIASVIAGVLGIESGASIDRERTVVDYGINSLTAMDVRNRLQTALGAKLPATLVLKYPTVSAMTRCILDQLQAEENAVPSEQIYWNAAHPDVVQAHEVNGVLPTLSPTINALIAEEHTPHFNVGMFLEFEDAMFDLEAFKTALKIMLTYHDGARLRFYPVDNRLTGEIVPLGDDINVVDHDFSDLNYAAGAEKMVAANNELQASMSFTREDPLYRFAHYKLNDANPHRVLLLFHHYISDATSQQLFGQGLTTVYQKILRREKVALPAKVYTLHDWTKRLDRFTREEAIAQIPYWLERMAKSRPSFIRDDFKSTRERRLDDYVNFAAEMEPADYARITAACRARKCEVADLGTYALVRAFSKITGSPSLWVDLITHGRSGLFPEVELPDLFGQISESGSVLFEIAPGEKSTAQIDMIRQQRITRPNGGIGLRALFFANRDPDVRRRLGKDEMPQIGLNFDLVDYEVQAEQTWFRFARESMGTPQGLHLRKSADEVRLSFFIAFRSRGGQLRLTIAYYKDRFYEETIAGIARDVFATMKAFADETTVLPASVRGELMTEGKETTPRDRAVSVTA